MRMKKRMLTLITLILSVLFLAACNPKVDRGTVKNGTYAIESQTMLPPRVVISDKDILFAYDMLSSYLPVGGYKVEEDVLTMVTNDDKYKYVFLIEGDSLIFLENESSKVKLTDERFGVMITDKAEFKMTNN